MEKVAGPENPGDALTTYLAATDLNAHLESMGHVIESGRAETAPQLTTSLAPEVKHSIAVIREEQRRGKQASAGKGRRRGKQAPSHPPLGGEGPPLPRAS